jgi:hypothetical protein
LVGSGASAFLARIADFSDPGNAIPLTRSHLATMLTDSIGLSKSEARSFVASFYEELTYTLEAGEKVPGSEFSENQQPATVSID